MSIREIDLDFESNCPICFGAGHIYFRNAMGLTQTECSNKLCKEGKIHLEDLSLEDDSPTSDGGTNVGM